MNKEQRDKLREYALNAWQEPMEFNANVPFYVEVKKPRPSNSKHDDKRPTYWNYDDGLYIAATQPKVILELLDYIDTLEQDFENSLQQTNYSLNVMFDDRKNLLKRIEDLENKLNESNS